MNEKTGGERNPQIYKTLVDGLECLLELCAKERPVGSREMSRELGIEHTRVSRFLGTLREIGLAERTEDRKYIPGAGLHVLASLALRGSHLLEAAMPSIRRLGEKTDMRIALGVRWRTHVCYLFHGRPDERTGPSLASRGIFPVEESSIGLTLLGELGADEIGEIFRSAASHRMPEADLEKIQKAARESSREGYAVAGNRLSVAVTVGRPAIAGLALAREPDEGPALDKKELRKALDPLQAAGDEITRRLARRR